MASVRSCENLPPCLIKPVPASSKMDPSLSKVKLISNGGTTCDNIFQKGKKPAVKWQLREKSETIVRKTTLQIPRSVKKEGEEILKTPEQRVLPCRS